VNFLFPTIPAILQDVFGVISAGYCLQVVADQLVQAFAQGFRLLTGARHQLLVNGESYIHSHIIRAHIYLDDASSPVKQSQSYKLFSNHLRDRSGYLSLQVLQEYFVTPTRKLRVAPEVARRKVELYAALHVVSPSLEDILASIDIHRVTRMSFWDGLIVRAAQKAECKVLYTEDMQNARVFDGSRVVNPFT
jgi:predicted nucleic acid-binding protein